MTITVLNNVNTNVVNSNDPVFKAGINIKDHTNAPLQMQGEAIIHCKPEELWPLITEPSGIAQWFPIVYGGSRNAAKKNEGQSCTLEGDKRFCKTVGMGTLDETFLYWEENKANIYNVKNMFMPIKDNHAAVMILEEIEPGVTKFTWLQYYELKGFFMRFMFPFMMTSMMTMGFKKLAKMFGGPGGVMRTV